MDKLLIRPTYISETLCQATGLKAFVYLYVFFATAFSGVPILARASWIFLAGLIAATIFYKCRFSRNRWFLLPLMFFVFSCATSSFLDDFERARMRLSMMLVTTLGGIAVGIAISSGVHIKTVIYGLVHACWINVLASILGLSSQLVVRASMEGNITRQYGLTADPNELSIKLVISSLLIFAFSKKRPFLLFSSLALTVFGMTVTGSRTGLLLGVMFFVYLPTRAFFIYRKKSLKVLILVLLGLTLLTATTRETLEYFREVPSVSRLLVVLDGGIYNNPRDRSFGNRFTFLMSGINYWKESAFVGHGIEQFSVLSGIHSFSHNNYVELLCSTGLIGFVLFYGIHVLIVLRASDLKQPYKSDILFVLLGLLCADMCLVLFYLKHTYIILYAVVGFLYQQDINAAYRARGSDDSLLFCLPSRPCAENG